MDFLPVNNSHNLRLQYTQSYVLPHDGMINPGFELSKPSIIHINIQENNISKQGEINSQQISSKMHQQQLRLGPDIDQYIKQNSSKIMDSSVSIMGNQSNLSSIHLDHQLNNIKPLILQSKVENIIISQSGTFKKIPPQFAETNDYFKLPPIKQSDMERFNSSNGIQSLVALEQSRRSSIVPPLHRKLQQSSVNINMDSQIRNNKQLHQEIQSIYPVDSLTEQMNSNLAPKLTRNIQKVAVAYPAQQRVEKAIHQENRQNIEAATLESINIPQIFSSSDLTKAPKQTHQRNILKNIEPEPFYTSQNQVRLLPIEEKRVSSIQINDSFNEYLKINQSVPLKRNLQQSNIIKTVPKQIVFPSQVTQVQSYYNAFPQQRLLLLEKQKQAQKILIDSQIHQESVNSSKQIKQKRGLQPKKLQQSSIRQKGPKASKTPIQIVIDSQNEVLARQILKSSLKRSIQHTAIPQIEPKHVNFDQTEDFLRQSQGSNLKRQIDPPIHDQAINIGIDSSQEQNLNKKSKKYTTRHLEVLPSQNIFDAEAQKQITVHLNQFYQQSLQNSAKSSLRRNLQAPVAIHTNQQLKGSIHLNDKLETIQTPKNLTMQKRDLKSSQVNQANPQNPIIVDKNRAVPSLQGIKSKVDKVICEGWNPTNRIFNLFKLPSTTKNTGNISFKKNRINTCLLL